MVMAATSAQKRFGNAWGTLLTVSLGIVMVGLDATVVSIANPAIGKDLHASLADLQWITNSYLLALAVVLIPGGKLGDRFGRRLIFLSGVAGFMLSSVGVAVIGSVSGVIMMRTVQGAFGGLLMPNSIALIRAAFPPESLNRAVGIWSCASAAAIAGAPVVGGFLVENVSWQSVFLLNVPVGLATLGCGIIVTPESRESVRERFDFVGLMLLGSGVFCLVYGVIRAETSEWTNGGTVILLCSFAALAVGFVAVESRTRAPLVPLQLFRERSITLGVVTLLLNFFALYGVLFFVSLYFQNVQQLDAIQAGIRLLPLIGVFAVASPYAGRITTRFGPRGPICGGLVLTTASLGGMIEVTDQSSFWVLCPSLIGIGLGVALVVVASTEAVVASAPVDKAGLAGGLQGIAIQLGGVLGSSTLGLVLASRVRVDIQSEVAKQGLGPDVATQLTAMRNIVDQGSVPAVGNPNVRTTIAAISHHAFLSGLHLALLVGGVATFAGAICRAFISASVDLIDRPTGIHF
jgi:EmrB/QacA subfamily drug resistance transporter